MAKKILIFIFCFILVFSMTLLIILLLTSVPKNPAKPYFSSYIQNPEENYLNEVKISPIYIWNYSFNKKRYLITAFRNDKNRINFLKIFVAGNIDNQYIELSPLTSEIAGTSKTFGKDFKSFIKNFKFGDRIDVIFLIVKDKEKLEDLSNICSDDPRYCQIVEISFQKKTELEKFLRTKISPDFNFFIPALQIEK